MKPLLLALVLGASIPGIAHAARLVAGPFDAPLPPDGESYDRFSCSARYLGDSTAPVNVTFRAWSGSTSLGVRTVGVSRANPAASLAGLCGDANGIDQSCRQLSCVVSTPTTADQFRITLCVGEPGTVPICLPGR